ncbi:hypothetical protein [Microlunatus endophyticus]|nr:hypothetical protein [Microlunatus endophyticus]
MTDGVSGPPGRPDGFDVYPDGYGQLFDKAVEVLFRDARVRGMWLHGAFGRGAADSASDLDISIAIADPEFDEFAAGWRDWLAEITPTVNADPIAPGCFFAMTPGCERVDVISERVSDLTTTHLTRRVLIFDRDRLDATIPAPDDPPPNPETIAYVIKETLRTAANFDTVVVRDDWLLGVVSVQTVHSLLYQLFTEANKPQPPTGPKQWSFKLSPRHRRLLEALPVPQAERESVMAARQAAYGLFVAEAPAIADAYGVQWPADLERTVGNHLDRNGLGIPHSA